MSDRERAQAAHDALGAFWAALASDDDGALATRVFPATLAQFDPPLCAAFRASLKVTKDEAALIGTSTTVRILDEGALGFVSARLIWPAPRIVLPGEEIQAWSVVMIEDDRRWVFWGAPAEEDWRAVETIELSTATELGRPN